MKAFYIVYYSWPSVTKNFTYLVPYIVYTLSVSDT